MERGKTGEQTDGVFSCRIRLKPFYQQHFLPSSHSAAYLTQMLTKLFFTVMDDYRISLFLMQRSDEESLLFLQVEKSEVLAAELYSQDFMYCLWTLSQMALNHIVPPCFRIELVQYNAAGLTMYNV